MRVLALSSGGKDSCYAIWWALLRGWDVTGIITVRVTGEDSMTFQLPTVGIARLQAEAAGIPWHEVEVGGDEATEMEELEAGIREMTGPAPIDGIVCGALRSDYQRTRVERMCERLGLRSFTPLWHHRADQHMQEVVDHGFDVALTSVSADGLGREWLGTRLDSSTLDRLRTLSAAHRFNIDGEGGEFETAVLGAPWMDGRIEMDASHHSRGARHWLEIEQADVV